MKYICIFLLFFLMGLRAVSQSIDPYKYVATLQFDNRYQDYLTNKYEQVFPVSYSFNTIQDGNEDGKVDVEDACENSVRYSIGDSIYGTGRTGIANRGPNDQHPALYFHFVKSGEYSIYEYWLYYADNDYLNNHEHDWEKYFVYEKGGTPLYARISSHSKFYLYTWSELEKDEGHVVIGVKGGSHAMDNKNKKGVQIRYNGEVLKRKGRLDAGDKKKFPWKIYSNDKNVTGVIPYLLHPDCFYNGDPIYIAFPVLSNSKEYEKCSHAPWKREEWDTPPSPDKSK
jgi:hypothetical protein